MERTVVLLKPDTAERALVGEILHRFERMELKIVGMKMVRPDRKVLEEHYSSEKPETLQRLGGKTLKTYQEFGKDAKKDFGTDDPTELGKLVIGWLLDYMTRGPLFAVLLEGRHAVDNAISIAGPTMPVHALPGTIRGDYSTDSAAYANEEKRGVVNLIHISGSKEEAKFEEDLWFAKDEIHSE